MTSTQKDSEVEIAVAEKEKTNKPSMYDIIVHDNDETAYAEVIFILCRAFSLASNEALMLAKTVDTEGKGLCGTFTKEIANAKMQTIDIIKSSLVTMMPSRYRQIMMLKFTIEKSSN
jgi:ATP-dependent Clp protease adaptor protein ClpS